MLGRFWKRITGKPLDPKANTRVLNGFLRADSWPKKREILEKSQKALLTDATLALLRSRIMDQRRQGKNEAAEDYALHMRLLKDAQTHGVATAWESFQEKQRAALKDLTTELATWLEQNPELRSVLQNWLGPMMQDPDKLDSLKRWVAQHTEAFVQYLTPNIRRESIRALEELTRASIEGNPRQVLEDHQDVLLSDETIDLLRQIIADQQAKGTLDETQFEMMTDHLKLLEDAVLQGIPAAWEHFKKARWHVGITPEWRALAEVENRLTKPYEAGRRIA